MDRPRSPSPPKSACPRVSTMLMVSPPWCTAVFLARIVMPFSRSRSPESSTRSATWALARNAPDCHSIASTSVVLPWSTCATIATLRTSSRVARPTAVSWMAVVVVVCCGAGIVEVSLIRHRESRHASAWPRQLEQWQAPVYCLPLEARSGAASCCTTSDESVANFIEPDGLRGRAKGGGPIRAGNPRFGGIYAAVGDGSLPRDAAFDGRRAARGPGDLDDGGGVRA